MPKFKCFEQQPYYNLKINTFSDKIQDPLNLIYIEINWVVQRKILYHPDFISYRSVFILQNIVQFSNHKKINALKLWIIYKIIPLKS